jgi:hypothetical protein
MALMASEMETLAAPMVTMGSNVDPTEVLLILRETLA